MKKRIFAILLAISLLLFCMPELAQPVSATQNSITVQDPLRYGWKVLAQMPNAENLLFAYEQLAIGIANCQPSIKVYDNDHAITTAEVSNVVEAVRSDYPEFFWFGLGYSTSSFSGKARTIAPVYTMTGQQLENAKLAVEQSAALLLTGLEDKSDYEISKLLHDRLAAFMSYEFSDNDQTIYGALVEKQAVCTGYACAYQYLLQRAGIPAWKVIGSSINPATGYPEGHAWTMVCLDGSWYHTDLTWDDQGNLGNIYYAYLNVTTQQILQDHALNSFFANSAPDCSETSHNYFVKTNAIAQTFDTNQVTDLLKANNLQARLFVTGDINAFLQAWQDNISTIVSRLAITGRLTYGWRILGQEVLLYIQNVNAAAFPVGITLAALPANTDWNGSMDVTGGMLNIHYSDGSVQSQAMEENMLEGFDPAADRSQVIAVTAAGFTEYFTVTNTVTAPAVAPGDMNCDEKVDNSDVVLLLWHTLFPADYPLAVDGDITGDSMVDNSDVVYLLWHTLFPADYPL